MAHHAFGGAAEQGAFQAAVPMCGERDNIHPQFSRRVTDFPVWDALANSRGCFYAGCGELLTYALQAGFCVLHNRRENTIHDLAANEYGKRLGDVEQDNLSAECLGEAAQGNAVLERSEKSSGTRILAILTSTGLAAPPARAGTVRTEHGAWRTTRSAVLPTRA